MRKPQLHDTGNQTPDGPGDDAELDEDVTTNDVTPDELTRQQNPHYEPPEGMKLNPLTNELEPLNSWAFDTPPDDPEI